MEDIIHIYFHIGSSYLCMMIQYSYLLNIIIILIRCLKKELLIAIRLKMVKRGLDVLGSMLCVTECVMQSGQWITKTQNHLNTNATILTLNGGPALAKIDGAPSIKGPTDLPFYRYVKGARIHRFLDGL